MQWLQNWIVTKFLKGLLDKLPADGKKTLLGIIMFILSVISQMYPDNPASQLLKAVMEMLQSMGAVDYTNVSLFVVAIGVVHKILKWIGK